MKFLIAILSVLPAALAAPSPLEARATCVADNGCAGCGQVAQATYETVGGALVATAPGWATSTISGGVITLKNLSGSTITICDWTTGCWPLAPHGSCTRAEPAGYQTAAGISVSQH